MGHKLHLGCSRNYLDGFINIDFDDRVRKDMKCDLNKGIPFVDNSIEHINAWHILEHLDDVIFVMREIHRVLKPDGVADIRVPLWTHKDGFGDPSHKHYFNEQTLDQFTNKDCYFVKGIDFYFEKLEERITDSEIMIKFKPIK